MKTSLFIAAIASYLISTVYPSPALQWVISVLSILIVLIVFPAVQGFVRGLGLTFMAVGVMLLSTSDAVWTDFILGFGGMLPLLSLFALIPLIALPIELGRYDLSIQSFIQSKVKYTGSLYVITSSLSYLLSSFMNLAALPMVYHTMRPALDGYPVQHKDRFISRAITHGYSMPIVWTPVAPIVGIIVEMTGVKWSSILPIVIPFSLLGLLLDWIMGLTIAKRRLKQLNPIIMDELSAARESIGPVGSGAKPAQGGRLIHIGAAIVIFNASVSFLEAVTHLSFLLLVTMMVIPFAWLWSCLLGKGRQFFTKSAALLPNHLLKMKEQFYIFLCAGFMISAIQVSGAGMRINAAIGMFKDFIGPELFLLLIPLIPLALAFIGMHPAVGLALIAGSLSPQSLGISPVVIAIAMLTGAATAFMMGPYNATAGMMANLSGQSPYRISNWNIPFTITYLLMAIMLLFVLQKSG